jgi:hypothetical protein
MDRPHEGAGAAKSTQLKSQNGPPLISKPSPNSPPYDILCNCDFELRQFNQKRVPFQLAISFQFIAYLDDSPTDCSFP